MMTLYALSRLLDSIFSQSTQFLQVVLCNSGDLIAHVNL